MQQQKNVLQMGHLFSGDFIYLPSQIMKEKIYCQNIEASTPFQKQVQTFVSNNMPFVKILTIVPYATKFSFTKNSKCFYFQTCGNI